MKQRKVTLTLVTLFFLVGMCVIVLQVSWAGEASKKPLVKSPLSPAEAVKHFRLASGLRIELAAAEPQIESPVAMAFDEEGRLWVVEMRDYPNGPPAGQPPQGRMRILEDRDGDGFYEHSTIFAEGLLFANGLMPWRGGVLVTAAPSIMHLRSSKGGGRADMREVLFEGFAAQNPQLRVSHPNLGLDNWIYVANGLRGGAVVRSKTAGNAKPQTPINLGGMDFRFDLIHDGYEAISGMGQYGNTFDDWGRRFVCDNRHHLRQVVMENRYLKRNPYLAAAAVVEDISELGDGPIGSGGKIYPISSNWTTSSLHVGQFTAACAVFVYRGKLLPEPYRGAAFTCDPTGNLVHCEILEPRGATFHSRPAQKGVEFLASPDDWFRPVFLTSGPDGAMYVVDMYRAVIEHPEFMPPELKNRPDLTLGKDKGRIWRIVREGAPRKHERPHLSKLPSKDLAALLENPDAWFRVTAQRLLLERQDKEAVDDLRRIALGSASPYARVHAAWLLENYGALQEAAILELLKHDHARVREHAVLLGESRIGTAAPLQQAIASMAKDPDARVRFQVALTLGEWNDSRILAPLAHIAIAGAADLWTRLAVESAVPTRTGLLLAQLLRSPQLVEKSTADHLLLIRELTAVVGARRDAKEVDRVLESLQTIGAKDPLLWQQAGLNGLTAGLGRRGTQLSTFVKSLPSVKNAKNSAQAPVVQWLDSTLAKTAGIAANPKRSLSDRRPAIHLLAHASWPVAEPVLAALLSDDPDQDIRLAAVRALAAHNRPEVSGLLMKSWRTFMPAVRREVLEAMLRQPARVEFLLDELEAKHIKPADIDAPRTRQLLNHGQAKIRDRARKLLRDNLPADRKLVVARYQEALKLKGDSGRGREVFKKNCATCHRIAGIGVDVGPDIGDTRTKTTAALLVDILNPNQAIDNNAISYLITTKSGRSLTGLIAAETASSITLRRAEGQTDVVLRQDIDEIQSTGISLMPDGLEKTITIPEMADLLSFLKNWRYIESGVPVGQ
jgi:putative membrane-bound dehydrogenase-like protein